MTHHLLDTHVLLWLLADPASVPDSCRRVLADRDNRLLVSAASALEVATKVRLGKLHAPELVSSWPHRIAEIGASDLPITVDHALNAGSLDWAHRDPFDRLLVAQAIQEAAVLVTVDSAIRRYPAVRVLTWG